MQMKHIKKFAIYLLIITASVCFVFFILINSIQKNIFSNQLNPVTQNVINTIFLEGFGFFTKDPKDEQLKFFEILKTNNIIEVDLKSASKENYYGFSRITRRKLLELGKIQKQIPDSIWKKTRSDSIQFLSFEKLQPFKVKKTKELKLLQNGKYLIYKYNPIFWEWNKIKKTYETKYIYINLK